MKNRFVLLVSLFLALLIMISFIIGTSCHIFLQSLAASKVGIEVPILMYHHILDKNSPLIGAYAITPRELEADLKYLKEQGYETVFFKDIINYENGGILPLKPIVLTFDDGYYNNYHYAFKLLKKYNMKAEISIIGVHSDYFSDNPNRGLGYSHITWNDMKEMTESGLVRIENHTYDLHTNDRRRKGSNKVFNESKEEYKKMFTEDVSLVQDKIFEATGIKPVAFTYPFGFSCNLSRELVKEMGFEVSLSCRTAVNIISRESPLYDLYRINRPHGKSAEHLLLHARRRFVE